MLPSAYTSMYTILHLPPCECLIFKQHTPILPTPSSSLESCFSVKCNRSCCMPCKVFVEVSGAFQQPVIILELEQEMDIASETVSSIISESFISRYGCCCRVPKDLTERPILAFVLASRGHNRCCQ